MNMASAMTFTSQPLLVTQSRTLPESFAFPTDQMAARLTVVSDARRSVGNLES